MVHPGVFLVVGLVAWRVVAKRRPAIPERLERECQDVVQEPNTDVTIGDCLVLVEPINEFEHEVEEVDETPAHRRTRLRKRIKMVAPHLWGSMTKALVAEAKCWFPDAVDTPAMSRVIASRVNAHLSDPKYGYCVRAVDRQRLVTRVARYAVLPNLEDLLAVAIPHTAAAKQAVSEYGACQPPWWKAALDSLRPRPPITR